jgi:hypothetical protein
MKDVYITQVELPLIGKLSVFRYKDAPMTEERLRRNKSLAPRILYYLLHQDECLYELTSYVNGIEMERKNCEVRIQKERQQFELQQQRYKVLLDAGLATEADTPRPIDDKARPVDWRMEPKRAAEQTVIERALTRFELARTLVALALGEKVPATLILQFAPWSGG